MLKPLPKTKRKTAPEPDEAVKEKAKPLTYRIALMASDNNAVQVDVDYKSIGSGAAEKKLLEAWRDMLADTEKRREAMK